MPRRQKKTNDSIDCLPAVGTTAVGSGEALKILKAYFPIARHRIRIASAYFTLSGHAQLKNSIPKGVEIEILVGREEGRNVERTIIKEILDDLGYCEEELWRAAADLTRRLKDRALSIKDARESKRSLHCKIFLVDDTISMQGSANYTRNGLRYNLENIDISNNPERADVLHKFFEEQSSKALDIVDQLILALEEWLKLRSPFEIYLKFLHVLLRKNQRELGPSANSPAYYQRSIANLIVTRLLAYGGFLLIAATGVGKTIIGAEVAAQLMEIRRIKRVLAIIPNTLQANWKKEFKGREIYPEFFTPHSSFRELTGHPDHVSTRLIETLTEADENTLIIIDEAQFYKNRLLDEKTGRVEREAFASIEAATRRGSLILLLTATAYSTTYHNINSLLRFIPKKRSGHDRGNYWEVPSNSELSLPTILVFGIPALVELARRRGDIDEYQRIKITLPNRIFYLPSTLTVMRVEFEPDYVDTMANAFSAELFSNKKIYGNYLDDSYPDVRIGVFDSRLNHSEGLWLSSPPALTCSLQNAIKTLTKKDFPPEDSIPLNKQLSLILKNSKDRYPRDSKFKLLLDKIKQHRPAEKIIIYTTYYLTALYLKDRLEAALEKNSIVACTVARKNSSPTLKSPAERVELFKLFSPKSHALEIPTGGIDILICTDADGFGNNLQDATVVINYDLSWPVDALFQRIGRIFRMSESPDRNLTLYNFVPTLPADASPYIRRRLKNRLTRLFNRHDASKNTSGLTIFGNDERFLEIPNKKRIDFLQDLDELIDKKTSIDYKQLWPEALLDKHLSLAASIPDNVFSAIKRPDIEDCVVVLFALREESKTVIMRLNNESLDEPELTFICELLHCSIEDSPERYPMEEIERLANRAVSLWCAMHKQPIEKATKLASLLIQSNSCS